MFYCGQLLLIAALLFSLSCSDPHLVGYEDSDLYSPVFEEVPTASKKPFQRSKWIDPQIEQDVQTLDDDTAKKFASRIFDICQCEISNAQVKQMVFEIVSKSESPTYLRLLPEKCSAKIVATVPFLLDDPYYRVLTGFQNHKGNDAYLEAILSNDKRRLAYLSKIVDLSYDTVNQDGITPLLAACRMRNYYEVKRMLNADTPSHHRDPLGRTALHLLAQYCPSVPLIRRLMKKNTCDVNIQDSQGNTALHLAYLNQLYGEHHSMASSEDTLSTTGSLDSNPADSFLGHLILFSADLDANIRNHNGDTVLHLASRELDHILIEQLLPRETIDVAIPDQNGQTALMIVLAIGRQLSSAHEMSKFSACLAAFIKKGVHVDPLQRFGPNHDTILHLMCQERKYSAVNELLKSPVEGTDLTNDLGLTPFQIAFESDGNSIGPMTSSFIENGCADVAALLNRNGDTILHIACRDRDLETVKRLMKYPLLALNLKNRLDQTPLQCVYMSQMDQVTGPLTPFNQADIPVDSTTKPTTEAFIIDELLNNIKTDLNVRNLENDALIHVACRKNDYHMVAMLLKHSRTMVNLLGRDNQTPIQIAFDLEHLNRIDKECKNCSGDEVCPNRSILCLLLRHRNVNPVIKPETTSLLHAACEASNLAAIHLLLRNKNTVVNTEDLNYRTPLKIALQRDSQMLRKRFGIGPITKTLLDSTRINPNEIINEDGDTLLHVACRERSVVVVQYLCNLSNINMNVRNRKEKMTPLQMAYALDQKSDAAARSPKPYIGDLTIAIVHGPNVECDLPLDPSGNTILHLLIESFYAHYNDVKKQGCIKALIELVLSQPALNPNIANNRNQAPLLIVYRNEQFRFTKEPERCLLPLLLKQSKVDPNIPLGKHGGSLLHVACLESNLAAVESLLGHFNVDILIQDCQGCTPLHLALEAREKKASALPNDPTNQIVHLIFQNANKRLTEEGVALLVNALKENIESEVSKR